MERISREQGYALTKTTFITAFQAFFHAMLSSPDPSFPHSHAFIPISIVEHMLNQLKSLRQDLSTWKLQLRGASLLLVYDASKVPVNGQAKDSLELDLCGLSDTVFYNERVRVFLIDFAHSTWSDALPVDEDALRGIETVINALETVLEIHSSLRSS